MRTAREGTNRPQLDVLKLEKNSGDADVNLLVMCQNDDAPTKTVNVQKAHNIPNKIKVMKPYEMVF